MSDEDGCTECGLQQETGDEDDILSALSKTGEDDNLETSLSAQGFHTHHHITASIFIKYLDKYKDSEDPKVLKG